VTSPPAPPLRRSSSSRCSAPSRRSLQCYRASSSQPINLFAFIRSSPISSVLTCCWRCATPTCQPARLPLLPVQLQPHHALAHVPPPARPRLDDEDAAKFRNMLVPVRFQLRQGLKVPWQKSADRGSDACCPQRRRATGAGWSCPTTVLVALGGEEPHDGETTRGRATTMGRGARFRGGAVPPASPYLCGLGLAKLASSTAACGGLCSFIFQLVNVKLTGMVDCCNGGTFDAKILKL